MQTRENNIAYLAIDGIRAILDCIDSGGNNNWGGWLISLSYCLGDKELLNSVEGWYSLRSDVFKTLKDNCVCESSYSGIRYWPWWTINRELHVGNHEEYRQTCNSIVWDAGRVVSCDLDETAFCNNVPVAISNFLKQFVIKWAVTICNKLFLNTFWSMFVIFLFISYDVNSRSIADIFYEQWLYSYTSITRIAKGNWNYFELSGFIAKFLAMKGHPHLLLCLQSSDRPKFWYLQKQKQNKKVEISYLCIC